MPGTGERVVVPGGSGFIGRQVVRLLDAGGYEVHVLAANQADAVPASVHFHEVDLLAPGERARAVAAVAAPRMVHLAWFVKPGQVWNALENVEWVEASLGLLREFAAAGGRRAVLAGTCSEYGPEPGLCHEETTATAPSSLYGVCKDALRAIALRSAPELGLSVAWARIFMAYGPGEHPRRLVASVIGNLLRGETAPTSHGRQVRDYLSTPEIAGALVSALESGFEGVVNVGSGRPVALREVIGTIAEAIGRPDLISYGAITPPGDDPPYQVADVRRLNEEIGWASGRTLAEGLEETIAWWRRELDL